MPIKKILIALAVFAVAGIIISYCSPQTWLNKKGAYTGKEFERVKSLEESSLTQAKVDEILKYLKDESETSAMMVVEDGKVVLEYGNLSRVSYIASCRKSVLSMLYGKYVDNGTIDLDETIGSIGIDEDDGLLPIEKQATVRDVISSRSGVFHLPANGGYDEKNIKERGSVKPGEYFVYNNWDFNVAGYILEKKVGKTVYEVMEEQLAIPLGFQDWNIKNQKRTVNEDKSRYSAYHIHISTRDMAKIGQLMLQNGKWNDTQIISEEWIKESTGTITPVDTVIQRDRQDKSSPVQFAYGYMWWLFDRFYDNPDFEGAYTASGYAGQYITVIPKRNMVVVHKTVMDLLTLSGRSWRKSTPSWRYWWILRNLLLNKKSINELAQEMSIDEMIEFLKVDSNHVGDYNVSERLINEYGRELMEEEKYEEAIKLFELNLEMYPQGFYTHRTLDNYGYCLQRLGRNEEAKSMYEKSIEFNPENEDTQNKLTLLEEAN